MKWSAFAEFRTQSSHLVDVKPAARLKDVRDQMMILLHQTGVRHFPVVGSTVQEGLVISHSGSYLIGKLATPFYSTVLVNNNNINGAPLPHPVDGSFVFMVAEKVAKRRCQSPQQQQEFLGHVLYHYTKLRRADRRLISLPNPRYRTVTFELLVESGLLYSPAARNPFELLSLNELYHFNENY